MIKSTFGRMNESILSFLLSSPAHFENGVIANKKMSERKKRNAISFITWRGASETTTAAERDEKGRNVQVAIKKSQKNENGE
jgi:hypothetical protein